MFLFVECYICRPLRSIRFHGFHYYYESVRLLIIHQVILSLQNLVLTLTSYRDYETSQVHVIYLACSPSSIDPDNISMTSPYRSFLSACYNEECIGCCFFFFFFILTRLNHFTLSHFGSQAPLSTLKPNVTILAPRLSTGCWLNFTRLGLPPNYILHTELAHPLYIY